jgi:sugar phosphate isomerase/epimerase
MGMRPTPYTVNCLGFPAPLRPGQADLSIELALTPDARWGADAHVLVDAAADAGFVAVGLPWRQANADARIAYADAGLRCHEVLALVVGDDEAATVPFATRLAEAAATVDAQWVLTTFRSGPSPETAKVVARCAGIIAEAGARMAVEFSPLGPVTSISAGLELVEAAGPGAGLIIDSWHFCHGDSTWDDLERLPLERIAYIQFTDAAVPASDDGMDETMNRRLMPGMGKLPLDRFADTLLDRGWRGLVSVEVLNRELLQLPVLEIARLAYTATLRFWT